MAASLFDSFDAAALNDATVRFGTPMALAAGPAGFALATDNAVSPQLMLAAMVRAHAQGLAVAAAQTRLFFNEPAAALQLQELLVAAAIAEIRARLAESNATHMSGSAVQ